MIKPEIYPCILAYSKDAYRHALSLIEQSNAVWAQVDFEDGNFVNNLSVLPKEIEDTDSHILLEAHLMVSNPSVHYSSLKEAGFKRVLLHREIYANLNQVQEAIFEARQHFAQVGLVLNPDTQVEDYRNLSLDSIQCMAVYPGESGQLLLDSVYDTIKLVKQQNLNVVIAVDGGVNEHNIKALQKAGVSRFIMASALFKHQGVAQNFQYYLNLIQQQGGV